MTDPVSYLGGIIAPKLITYLINKGYSELTKDSTTTYQDELVRIIFETISEFESTQKANIIPHKKTPFFKSDIIVTELLKFRFSTQLDIKEIELIIAKDERIVVPQKQEIEVFLDLFNLKIKNSNLLKDLNITDNYKEEIYNISNKLNELNNKVDNVINQAQENIQNLEVSNQLINEWTKQLDEIKDDLYKFRPNTAFSRLENVQCRIENKNISNDELTSQIFYLKASALYHKDSLGFNKSSAELFVKAYLKSPNHTNYKEYAALSYLTLKQPQEAKKLSNQILSDDPYNSTGWTIDLYLQEDLFSFINTIPKIVWDKRDFKLNVFSYLLQNQTTLDYLRTGKIVLEIDFEENEPQTITYTNIKFWILSCEYLFSQIHSKYPTFYGTATSKELQEYPLYKYYNNVLKKITFAINGSEIENTFANIYFKYYFSNIILNQDKSEVFLLEKNFHLINNPNFIVATQMVQAYLLLDQKEYDIKSLDIIEKVQDKDSDLIVLFKSMLLFKLGQNHLARKNYEEYIKNKKQLTINETYNLMQFIKIGYQDVPEEALVFLDNLINQKELLNDTLKSLLELYVKSLYQDNIDNNNINSLAENIESEINNKYKDLKEYYLHTLQNLKMYDRIITYLRPTINFIKPSKDLNFFCQALFYSQGNKIELLQVLKKVRVNLPPDKMLLHVELHLRQKQKDWKKVIEVAEYAITHFPSDIKIISCLFLAMSHEVAIDKILSYKYLLKDISLNNEHDSLIISSALFQAGQFEDSLELLYQSAIIPQNRQSQQEYFSSAFRYPDTLFLDYETLIEGCYIKYISDNKTNIIQLTSQNKDQLPQSLFKNRQLGESFMYSHPFSGKTHSVTLLRLMNKYLALWEKLIDEAKDPLSGLKIQEIQLPDGSIEEINKTFIKELGAIGSLQHQHKDTELSKYYNGQISFSEIVISVFNKNPFDAYYFLTSTQSNCFNSIIPYKVTTINLESSYVLDASTLALFYELSQETNITYNKKFIISTYIENELNYLIENTRLQQDVKMSLDVTLEGVRPIFFADDFRNNRLTHLRNLLSWIKDNCVSDAVDEKLNDIMDDQIEKPIDRFLLYLLDNKLLSERPNTILITSDSFYQKIFNLSEDNFIPPQAYLTKLFADIDFTPYLLSKKYIGINIKKNHLINEFSASITGKTNYYGIALENLKITKNGNNLKNLFEGILFLKWLYIQPIITSEIRYRAAYYTLTNILGPLNDQGVNMVKKLIRQQFSLLLPAQDELINIIETLRQ